MRFPKPTPLFHITSTKNLEKILRAGSLQSKRLLDEGRTDYCNVAHESIQERRSSVVVTKGAGGMLHDYVPFYFAPRSPMLYTIGRGNVAGCAEKQEDIIHLVTTAEIIDAAHLPYVFTNGHAIMQPLEIFDSLADIDKVDWEIMLEPPLIGGYAKYWQDNYSNPNKPKWTDRKRRRQAEFLVHQRLPWQFIHRIGVMNQVVSASVKKVLETFGLSTPLEIKPDWYH